MNPGPSFENQQLFVDLCREFIANGDINPHFEGKIDAEENLADFINNVPLDTVDFNADINGKPILWSLALIAVNSKRENVLKIILQKADLNKINFNATGYYGALGDISIIWLIACLARSKAQCLQTIVERADLTKIKWNIGLGSENVSTLWMVAYAANNNTDVPLQVILDKKIPDLDLTIKPNGGRNKDRTVKDLIDNRAKKAADKHPAPSNDHYQPPYQNPVFVPFQLPPIHNIWHAAFGPPMAPVAPVAPMAPMAPVAPVAPAAPVAPPPPPPHSPKRYQLMLSILAGALTAAVLATQTWPILIGCALAASACTFITLKARSHWYNQSIATLPPKISQLPILEQNAYLDGERAATSMTHYFKSFFRSNDWRHPSTFGAGMQEVFNQYYNPAYVKRPK